MKEHYFIEAEIGKIALFKKGNADGPAIIFIHGASLSSRTWYHQFNNPELLNDFQLYAFDLPGHGLSEKLKNAEGYSLKGLGNIIAQIIGQLQTKQYILATLSIGGNIAAECVNDLKNCKGIFMTGPSLLGNNFPVTSLLIPNPFTYLLTAVKGTREELEGYANTLMQHPSENDTSLFSDGYENTDPEFRIAIGKVLAASDYSDEIENLKRSGLPLALVYGKEEAVVQPFYLQDACLDLWRNKIHLVAKAGHLVNIDQPETFSHFLHSFASEICKK